MDELGGLGWKQGSRRVSGDREVGTERWENWEDLAGTEILL